MPDDLHLVLPPNRTSPRAARAATRACLGPLLDAGDVELAVLVVSELVTDAVLHAGTTSELRLEVTGDRLRVAVRDGDTHPPVRRLAPTDRGAPGRGVRLLQALGAQWGVDPEADGKVVWWELALAPTGT